MTKDEALKLALKTLEQIQEGCSNVIADKLHSDAVDLAKLVRKDCNKPIDAIREALAQPEFVLNGIDCSCGRKWRVVNNTLTASEQPEQEPKKIPESLATHGSLWIESLFASPQSEQEKNGC